MAQRGFLFIQTLPMENNGLMGSRVIFNQKKYNVYFYKDNSYNVDNEVEKICKDAATKVVFIIDNYSNKKKVLDAIKLFGQDSIVILSERSVINEVSTEWLFPKFDEFEEFDINILSTEDLKNLFRYLMILGSGKRRQLIIYIKRKTILLQHVEAG